ncbi:MAG: hypothetical protein ACI3XC_00460, partial [Phascolarctobacterium sp.]
MHSFLGKEKENHAINVQYFCDIYLKPFRREKLENPCYKGVLGFSQIWQNQSKSFSGTRGREFESRRPDQIA